MTTTVKGGGTPPPSELPLMLGQIIAEDPFLSALAQLTTSPQKERIIMGYNVSTRGSDFTIPADKLDAATQALKDLNKRDELKSGGSYGPGDKREYWFSWMPANYDETMHTAAEILESLGFTLSTDNDGSISIDYYDSKSGDEDKFIAALAPFVAEGSYINWEGEDGQHWRDEVRGGEIMQFNGSIVYK